MGDLLLGSKLDDLTHPSRHIRSQEVVPTFTSTVHGKYKAIALDPTLPFFFPCPENPAKNITDVLESRSKQKFHRTESSYVLYASTLVHMNF
jgi:hypothetical protein